MMMMMMMRIIVVVVQEEGEQEELVVVVKMCAADIFLYISESSKRLWLFPGSFRVIPRKNPRMFVKKFGMLKSPESQGSRQWERLTCPKPWVWGFVVWKAPLQPSWAPKAATHTHWFLRLEVWSSVFFGNSIVRAFWGDLLVCKNHTAKQAFKPLTSLFDFCWQPQGFSEHLICFYFSGNEFEDQTITYYAIILAGLDPNTHLQINLVRRRLLN